MQRASRETIVATCIGGLILGTALAFVTAGEASADRGASAAEIIVLSDDIHKKTTEVVHAGDTAAGDDNSKSGLGDGTNPGAGDGTTNSPNQGTNNPNQSKKKK